MRSTISALVIAMASPCESAQLRAELASHALDEALMQPIDFFVGQSAVGRTIGDRIGEALLAGGQRIPAIEVEDPHTLDRKVGQLSNCFEHRLGFECFIRHDRQIADDRGVLRKWLERNAARSIGFEFFEVKLEHPRVGTELGEAGDPGMEASDVAESIPPTA